MKIFFLIQLLACFSTNLHTHRYIKTPFHCFFHSLFSSYSEAFPFKIQKTLITQEFEMKKKLNKIIYVIGIFFCFSSPKKNICIWFFFYSFFMEQQHSQHTRNEHSTMTTCARLCVYRWNFFLLSLLFVLFSPLRRQFIVGLSLSFCLSLVCLSVCSAVSIGFCDRS